ncbi:MAG: hypothetical protein F6K40_32480 [Okeania sp. SIO3I5]|uniref:GUN4 domain-containing protein n=1 Tax=Okeania sp. SIO3I5 TaxID=2607805 RepID=UPI0013BAFA7C|nr:GUN4 domain-containing protein [Okeania sp. SIO3I5]NEQ40689.1 hypothetical protein [Okeania sp. SIO3I5]
MPESTENSKQIITLGDQPTTKDELGFTPYVIAMGEFLTDKNTKPPLTISIEGEWGSGKSSFMKQLETEVKRKSKELDQEDLKKIIQKDKFFIFKFKFWKLIFKQKTQTIWFNAWRHEKSESLWASFALSFLEQLSNNRNCVINIYHALKLSISRFNVMVQPLKVIQILIRFLLIIFTIVAILVVSFIVWVRIIPYLSEILADVVKTDSNLNESFFRSGLVIASFASIVQLIRIIGDLIGDPKMDLTQYLNDPNYEKQVAFVEKFHEDFSKIVNTYVDKDEKIYVFIDDIDRCELGKSADLLQALNMMISNDPNIIFILGMDREKVAAAISFKQRDIIPFLSSAIVENQLEENEEQKLRKKVDYGFSFLEKFVQLSFLVPAPSQNKLDGFVEKILKMQAETKADPEKQEKRFFGMSHSFFGRVVKVFNFSAKLTDIKHLLQELIEKVIIAYFLYNFYLLARNYPLNDRLFFYFYTLIQQRYSPKKVEKTETKESSVSEQNLKFQEAKTSFPDLAIFPIIEKDLDSQSLAKIIEIVAPFFDYNPRRLKQYINALRLRIYIAYYSIGVTFDEIDKKNTLNLEQISKFTALILKYPRLLLALRNNLDLLAQLEKDAVDKSLPSNNSIVLSPESKPNDQETGNANYWLKNYPKIQQLLCSEMTLNNEQKYREKYIFENASIKKLLEVSLPQSLPPQYFKLREFLAAKKWKEADEETYRVMLQVAGREKQEYLEKEDVEKFPCAELYIVDKLWVKYSDNKFGFSVQKKIMRGLGFKGYKKEDYQEVWKLFIAAVGWDYGVNYQNTSNRGHLPFIVVWERKWVDFWIFSRAEICRL